MARTDTSPAPAATVRETVPVTIGTHEVILNAPKEGQIAVLRRIAHLLESEDPAARGQGGTLFLDIADTLVTDPVMLQRLYEGMATETLELEQYADGLIQALRHFLPVEEEGTAAIKPTRRQSTARANTRRPR